MKAFYHQMHNTTISHLKLKPLNKTKKKIDYKTQYI